MRREEPQHHPKRRRHGTRGGDVALRTLLQPSTGEIRGKFAEVVVAAVAVVIVVVVFFVAVAVAVVIVVAAVGDVIVIVVAAVIIIITDVRTFAGPIET